MYSPIQIVLEVSQKEAIIKSLKGMVHQEKLRNCLKVNPFGNLHAGSGTKNEKLNKEDGEITFYLTGFCILKHLQTL